jgi:hypothetical protein
MLLCLVFFLVACNSLPRQAESHAFHYFNFHNVKSYAFYDRNADFFDYQSLSGVIRNNIELAIENEADKQGLKYQPFEKADIIISYFWVKKKSKHQKLQQELQHYNKGINYCAACLNIKSSSNTQQSQQISTKLDSLIIDIIDPQTKRSVWRSSYPLNINIKENSQQVQTKINQAVKQMFKQYAVLHRS